jgi:squalene synthase HpnC
VPSRLRQHFCNVYAYCRWADDLADEPLVAASPGMRADELLEWWEEQLNELYAGRATHPVFIALRETVQTFQLPREPFADLLTAFRRDQVQTRYETMADLLSYCEKSANPVGRIVLHLGDSATAENVARSDAICTGLQLANFCQDVRRDWDIGRIYLPQEVCRRHGWDEARFALGRCDEEFRLLLAEIVEVAAGLFDRGDPLKGAVSRELRPAVSVFLGGGRAMLAAIRRARYDVWSRRPTVGRLEKAMLLSAAWWRG